MKAQEKQRWISDQYIACGKAIQKLKAAKRQSASAYDARMRKLNAFWEVLLVKDSNSAQLDLFNPEEALDPEITELLRAPLGGL